MSDELNQQDRLLDLVFGLLSEAEAGKLRAEIERDPVLAEAYSLLQADAELMGEAAKVQSPPIALMRPEPNGRSGMPTPELHPPIAGPEMTPWSRWAEWSLVAAAGLLVVLSLVGWTQRRSQVVGKAADQLRVQVTGPSQLQQSSESRYQIVTTAVTGRPVSTNVHFSVYSLTGDRLLGHTEKTGDSGTLQVAIPANLGLPESVRIEFETGEGELRQVAGCRLRVQSERLATYVRLDRSHFAPGDAVRYRAVSLSRYHLDELKGKPEVCFDILGPEGEVLAGARQQVVSEQGVAAGEFVLPADIPSGVYSLRVSSPDAMFLDVHREFVVSEEHEAQLQKDVEFAGPGYGPGMEAHAAVRVTRRDGTPVSGAGTEIIVKMGEETIHQESTSTDSLGGLVVDFRLPEQIGQVEPVLVVTVDDGTVRETVIEPVPLGQGEIDVEFFPEGGDLAAVGENRVYFTARDSNGEPVDLAGWIVDEEGNYQAKAETVYAGRGLFRFSPQVGVRYRLIPETPSGVLVNGQLPFVMPTQKVVLNTGKGVFKAGEQIEFNVRSSQAGLPLVAAASCRGVQVGEQAFLTRPSLNGNGRAVANAVAIAIPDSAAGVIRLTVFDYSRTPPRPVAERLVYRRPIRKLDVVLTADCEAYVPGQSCELHVGVSDEKGQPVGALLGLSVVEKAFLNGTMPGSNTMSSYFWLARQMEAPQDWEDANFLLEETPEAEVALDLLLGTQGWRRFAEPPGQLSQRDEMYGEPLGRWVKMEANTAPPLVLDNLPSLLADSDAARTEESSRLTGISGLLAALAVLGGAGLMVLVTMLSLLKVASGVRLWAPAMVAVSVSFLLVVLTISPDTSSVHAVAFQSYRPEDTSDEAEAPDAIPGPVEEDLSEDLDAAIPVDEARSEPELAEKAEIAPAPEGLEETRAPLGKPVVSDPQGEVERKAEESSVSGPGLAARLDGAVSAREYHRDMAGKHRGRADFEPTVLWMPMLKTDGEGQAKASFDLSDAVTRYRVIADGHGLGRIGSAVETIVTKLPFDLSSLVPEEMTLGDRVDLPLTITAESSKAGPVKVFLEADDCFESVGSTELAVTLDGERRDRCAFSVKAVGLSDKALIRFRGEAGEHVDRVERFTRIVPRGFSEVITRSGILEGTEEFSVVIPEDADPESVRATLTFYPTLAADLLAGLESIQGTDLGAAAARLVVADLLIDTLREAAIADPQALRQAKARREESLRRLADLQDSDGGYPRLEGEAPDAIATAGVVQVLQMDREKLGTSSSQTAKAVAWLGAHDCDPLDLAARAWRLWALAEIGETDLTKELEQVVSKALEARDAQAIALAVLAADRLGEEVEGAWVDALAGQQAEDGHVTASGLADAEMTAIGALALMAKTHRSKNVADAIAWLLSARGGSGGFGSSRATALALCVLAGFRSDETRVGEEAKIALEVGEEVIVEQGIGAEGGEAVALEDLADRLSSGSNTLRLSLTDGDRIPFTLSLHYSLRRKPADDEECPLRLQTELDTSKAEEGQTVRLSVRLENTSENVAVSPAAAIGLPAGLRIAPTLLESLRKAGKIAGYETRLRQVVLSWEAVAAGEELEVVLDVNADLPGQFTGPPSFAYLAQGSEARVWVEPLSVEIVAKR